MMQRDYRNDVSGLQASVRRVRAPECRLSSLRRAWAFYSLTNAWRFVLGARSSRRAGAPRKATGATMLDGLQVQRPVRPRPHEPFTNPIAAINVSQRARSSAGTVPDKFGEVTVPPTVLGVDCEAEATPVD
jgi:hypothetical protein